MGKYMSIEDNVFLAKRVIIDNIYRQAHLEGIGVTFAQTYDIVNNINASNLKPSEINDIINLKRAWDYILSDLNKKIDLAFYKDIHTIIGHGMETLRWDEIGEFRKDSVGVTGTLWRPEVPGIEESHNELMNILNMDDSEEKIDELYLWGMKKQLFKDGNKRVSNFVVNYYLIQNGMGLISIPVEKLSGFLERLVKFYESEDIEPKKNLISYIHTYCRYKDLSFLSDFDKENNEKNKGNISISDQAENIVKTIIK